MGYDNFLLLLLGEGLFKSVIRSIASMNLFHFRFVDVSNNSYKIKVILVFKWLLGDVTVTLNDRCCYRYRFSYSRRYRFRKQ